MSDKLSSLETIKTGSDGLRGTIKESLKDNFTGNVRPDDEGLVKFQSAHLQNFLRYIKKYTNMVIKFLRFYCQKHNLIMKF
jgi:hypothetical protein